MFEQPLYEFEPVAAPVGDSGLFKDYEIKSWVFTPRVIKIVALSAVVNIVAILVVGQTSLLTLKGCDSPLVGSVCKVLDTVYVGALLFGTDREYVDVAYDKTALDADDEITYIDASSILPPFNYPGDYFRIANPEKFVIPETVDDYGGFTQGIPGIPNGLPLAHSSDEGIFDTPQKLPTPNPNVLEGNLGGNNYNHGGGGVYFPPTGGYIRPKRLKTPKASSTPYDATSGFPDENTVAENASPSATPSPAATVVPAPTPDGDVKEDKFGVFINKRPLTDGAKDTLEKLAANQIKLDATFKVGLMGTLGLAKDGKTVVLKNPKPIPLENGMRNNPVIEKFVQDWILRLGDSGWLGHIEHLDENKKVKEKRVRIMLEQNDTEFLATVNAEQPDENTAKTLASGLNSLLQIGSGQTDGDEQLFLKASSSTSSGSVLTLNFRIPKPVVQEMIQRKLAELKAQPKPTDNSATTKSAENPAKN